MVIHRRKIDTMEESGEWIIKTSNNNQEVISDIRSNITRAKSTIDEVTVKLNDRRRRLETALSENQKLQITFDDFSSRVGKVDKSLARAKPVSAMYIEIREQKITHEVRFFRGYNKVFLSCLAGRGSFNFLVARQNRSSKLNNFFLFVLLKKKIEEKLGLKFSDLWS